MRHLAVLLVMTVVAVSSFAAQMQVSFSQGSDVFRSLVQIYSYFPEVPEFGDVEGDFVEAAGSGTIIAENGLILTNSHLVVDERTGDPAETVDLCYFSTEFHIPTCSEQAEIVAFSEFYDLALLRPIMRLDEESDDFVPIAHASGYDPVVFSTASTDPSFLPKIRDDVFIVGYPNATGTYQITATSGTITGYDSDQLEYIDLVTDAIINAGNSGGGAFNERDEFIGVPYANSVDGQGGQYGYIVPVTEVNGWFETLVEEEILGDLPVVYAREGLHEAGEDELNPETMSDRIAELELRAAALERENGNLQQRSDWVMLGGVLLFVLLALEWLRMKRFHEGK